MHSGFILIIRTDLCWIQFALSKMETINLGKIFCCNEVFFSSFRQICDGGDYHPKQTESSIFSKSLTLLFVSDHFIIHQSNCRSQIEAAAVSIKAVFSWDGLQTINRQKNVIRLFWKAPEGKCLLVGRRSQQITTKSLFGIDVSASYEKKCFPLRLF